ncbi:hypothetical protein UFOVP1601_29 [uncultured Caudovirales phage]|uniref:Uncharacterized protein n=1 Tax=uncultured Caudovirales phage TaxID=2100421 RepID=A0A6J5ST52_9CAUD|nr:hypothetical protein UFOVP1154_39 [uncultured Caudovirales phage]CAB4200673.1 hypothetical protein UFOVP1341_54 [uncultured Caudovirales phage]CAB4218623.1 hypothetical protein UFOVP1601_29 [uncultured Caudovirales phage]
MSAEAEFRFDAEGHRYYLDGDEIPSLSSLLKQDGLVDTTFMTDEGRDRGTAVHSLCTTLDLGAELPPLAKAYRGYLAAYEALLELFRPEWECIEEAEVSRRWRFGCRPDRVGLVYGLPTIAELKTGGKEPWHAIQLALQAIAVSERTLLPPDRYQRIVIYLKDTGRYSVEIPKSPRDYDAARALLKRHRP